jgi:nitrogen regulatory protein PII
VKRIEAYIQVGKLDAVQQGLFDAGVQGLSVTPVKGYGRQMGPASKKAPSLLPKLKIEVVVADAKLDTAVEAIIISAKTGEIGDGKIFISEVQESIRVRTGERGDSALD